MALVLKDRIKETSSTTGTGTLTLGGAVDGFRSFADIGDGNTTYYCIADGNNFEVGIGTYTASGTTLARTTVLQTSAGNTNKITCTGNQKVFVTQPASKAAYLDASNELVVASTALSSIQQRWTKTATSNQTVFSGAADNSGPTLAVNSSSHVFLNGIFLKETTDYALSGGTTVTLTAGATVNDIVEVITFTPLSSSITGISDGDIPVFTSGVADNDFLKVAGTSIEGRSASEVLSDIGGQSALTFGISSGNVPTFTSGVADNDFLKIDGTTVEGRSAAEVRSDLNVEDGATANSAGNAITISSGVINHSDTSSQASSNNSGRTYIQDITLDTYGHVTGLATATETVTDTNTTYSAGSGIDLSGTTFSHSDTSSQSSSNNSGRTYIQDITLDTYGHVTGIATATETVTNTDTNTTYSAGTNLGLSGTTFNLDNSITLSGTVKSANVVAGSSSLSPSSSGALAICGSTNPYISFHDAGSSTRDGYLQKIHSGDYFYFGETTHTTTTGSFRAPLFYDSNNTSYYCDPSGTSKLYRINLINQFQVNGATGNSGQVLTSNGSSAPTWQDAGGGAWEVIGNYSGNATGTNATVDFVHGSGGFVHDATTYKHMKMYAQLWQNNGATGSSYLNVFPLVGTTSSYAPMSNLIARHSAFQLIHPEFTGVTYNHTKWGYGAQSFSNNQGAVATNIRLHRSSTTATSVGMGMFSETINGTSYSSGDRFYPTAVEMDFPCKGIDPMFGFMGHIYYRFDTGLFDNYTYYNRWMMMGDGYGKVGWRITSSTSNVPFNYDITWIGLKP